MKFDMRAVLKALGLATLEELIEDDVLLRLAFTSAPLPTYALERLCRQISPDSMDLPNTLASAILSPVREDPRMLSLPESDWTVRMTALWLHALEVWQEPKAARAFLYRAHPALMDAEPIRVAAQSGFGTEIVHEILGRLQHGSAL